MLQVARRKPDLNLSMSLAPESLVLPSAVAQLRQPHVVQGLLGPLLDVCLSRGHASCSPTSPCAASSAPSERVPHSGLNTGFNTCILCVSSSRMKDLVRKTPFLSLVENVLLSFCQTHLMNSFLVTVAGTVQLREGT